MAFVSVFTIQQGFSKLLALATPHQPALPVPKCRQAWQLPPGGSQGAVAGAGSIQRSALFHPQMGGFAARVAKLATPYSRLRKTMGLHHSPYDTPSVSPFGLTAPSEREPRRLRRSGRQFGDPYSSCAKPWAHTIQPTTPPQLRFAQQLPQRWSQGCFAPGKRRDKFLLPGNFTTKKPKIQRRKTDAPHRNTSVL